MKMYNPQEIPQATLQWIVRNALNELNAFLCEGNPDDRNGKEWATDAREIAARCRAIAASATEHPEKREWLELAAQYEDTI
jgi:hypothetical protein